MTCSAVRDPKKYHSCASVILPPVDITLFVNGTDVTMSPTDAGVTGRTVAVVSALRLGMCSDVAGRTLVTGPVSRRPPPVCASGTDCSKD